MTILITPMILKITVRMNFSLGSLNVLQCLMEDSHKEIIQIILCLIAVFNLSAQVMAQTQELKANFIRLSIIQLHEKAEEMQV